MVVSRYYNKGSVIIIALSVLSIHPTQVTIPVLLNYVSQIPTTITLTFNGTNLIHIHDKYKTKFVRINR